MSYTARQRIVHVCPHATPIASVSAERLGGGHRRTVQRGKCGRPPARMLQLAATRMPAYARGPAGGWGGGCRNRILVHAKLVGRLVDAGAAEHFAQVQRVLRLEVDALVAKGQDVVLVRKLRLDRRQRLHLLTARDPSGARTPAGRPTGAGRPVPRQGRPPRAACAAQRGAGAALRAGGGATLTFIGLPAL